MKTLRAVKDLRLFKTNRIKNPPRYEDLSGRKGMAAVPSGRRVLTVLFCVMAVIGLTLLALRYFQHL